MDRRKTRFGRDTRDGSIAVPIGTQLFANLNDKQPPPPKDPRVIEANWLVERERLDEAAAAYRRILHTQPDHADALDGLAELMTRLDFPAKALPLLEQLARRRPQSARVRQRLARTLIRLGREQEALIQWIKAVQLKPTEPRIHNQLGDSLFRMKQFIAAADAYRHALEVDPQFLTAANNLGRCLIRLNRFPEAVETLQQAVGADREFAEAWANLGRAQLHLGESARARNAFDQATRQAGDNGEVFLLMGKAHHETGNCKRAIPLLRRAVQQLSVEPGAVNNPNRPFDGLSDRLAEAHITLANCLLGTGQLHEGWQEFRWRYRAARGLHKRIPTPEWRGERLDGKVLRVRFEQNFSDTIQFVRFLRYAQLRGPQIMLECQQPLKRLFDGIAGTHWVVGDEDKHTPVDHDVGCTLLELPRLLDVDLETVPASVPYLYAPSEASRRIKPRVRGKGIRVGLVWSGFEVRAGDPDHTVPMDALEQLMNVDGVSFHSLQLGSRAEDVRQLPPGRKPRRLDLHIKGYDDLAAALAQMDLLISVEAMPVHLAGAMGRSAWVMLPQVPDWRWQMDRDQPLWYPTLRLFHQDDDSGWSGVVAKVRAALETFVNASRQGHHY